MSFIYDILINFNDKLYDFYEWNANDSITHIRKIPVFKLSNDDFKIVCNNIIKIDKDFLTSIEKKCEVFTSRNVEIIRYACLFSNGSDVVCVKFNDAGESIGFSKLLIDEAMEVIEIVSKYKENLLKYEIVSNMVVDFRKTRMQVEKSNYILREINNLDKMNEIEKLRYLCFECFNEIMDNKSKMVEKLLQKLEIWDDVNDKMYNFFKLISVKNV